MGRGYRFITGKRCNHAECSRAARGNTRYCVSHNRDPSVCNAEGCAYGIAEGSMFCEGHKVDPPALLKRAMPGGLPPLPLEDDSSSPTASQQALSIQQQLSMQQHQLFTRLASAPLSYLQQAVDAIPSEGDGTAEDATVVQQPQPSVGYTATDLGGDVDMHEEEATTTTTTDTPHDQAERALQAMAAAQRANILGAAAMSSIRAMMTGPPPPLRRPKRAATGRMQFDEDDYEAGAFLPVDAVEEGGISSHELRPDETSGGGGGGGGGAGDGSGDGGAGDGVAAAAVAAADPLDSTDAVAILAAMGHVVTATASEAMASPGVQRTDEPAARASLSGWETGVKYVKQCQHAGCNTAARGSTRFCIAHGGGECVVTCPHSSSPHARG